MESLSAYELKAALAELGYSVSVTQDNGSASVNNQSILIGKTAATAGEMPSGNQYRITAANNGRIQISAGSYYGYRAALASIINEVKENDGIYAGAYSGDADLANADRATNDSVRVAFYNVLGYDWISLAGGSDKAAAENTPPVALRQDLQRDILSAYLPDVIGFQEYVNEYRSDFGTIMTGLEYTEVPTTQAKNNSPIFYRADKLSVVDSGFTLYTSEASASNKRGVTWAVFEDQAGNKLAVLNTHFLHTNASDFSATEHEDSAATVLSVISTIKETYGNDIAVIFGGDLNFKNGTGTAYTSLTNGGLTFASEIEGVQTNAGSTYSVHGFYLYNGNGDNVYDLTQSNLLNANPQKPQYTYDYIFVGDESSITVKKYIIVEEDATLRASDHSPTLIDLVFH